MAVMEKRSLSASRRSLNGEAGNVGRYMVAISRGVFLKGAGFAELWPQLAALTAYAVIVLLASSLLYRRRSG